MSSNQTTLIGQLAADPELRFLANGDAVASVTVAHSRRKFDKDKGEWVDSGEPLFLRGTVWRKHAENVTASLSKGDRVVVVGMLKQRSWENDAGEKRYAVEMDIEEIGPGLRYAEAKPVETVKGWIEKTKPVKNPKQGANVGTPPPAGYGKSASDPWGDVPPPPEPQSDEPPF
jgi:single-strand DNA-binding protein